MKKAILIISIIIIALLHYFIPVSYHHYHAILQRLYYVPVILASYWFGLYTGLILAVFSGATYAPHIFFQWSVFPIETFTQYIEIVMLILVAALVGILANIQRRQHEQIKRAQEQISHMDRLSFLGQLAAGLAHEIRNPLGSLLGSVEIIQDTLGKEHPKIEFVRIMEKEIKRLQRKLNEFLNFAKPAKPNIIPNNLNDVILAAITLVENQAKKASAKIIPHLDESLPFVPIDAELLQEIMLNLLLNAIQAMPNGGKIIMSSWAKAKTIGISIEDEGIGIQPEDQDKVFQPFYTTKKEGTGLGLAIVEQLIQSMKGSVVFYPGRIGTRFELRIPYE